MANPAAWIPYVEAFVDPSRPPHEHIASIEAIAALVKKDLLTLLALVREMEMYLTTTDHLIRSRGIVLLGEILTRISTKQLDIATINSLADFFISRLSDWQALRGALLGCLALLRRKENVGSIRTDDATKLADAFLACIQVQSLTANDRKLCFEVLSCLADNYPEAVATLGDDLFYGICEAIDEEKDPRCLVLSFHLVETVMGHFQDPSDSAARFAGEVFEILSKYFPIHFTHGGGDDVGITRDDLSRSLMHAFSSTPYFEPYAVPLLLEKLSSSLPLAKLDSLKYLSNCIPHYGADRMAKHAKTIWSHLKDVIFELSPKRNLLQSSVSTLDEEKEHQIVKEALNCLQTSILHIKSSDKDLFLNLVLGDNDIVKKFDSVANETIPLESQSQLNALGNIFSLMSQASTYFCTRMVQNYFPPLMDILGVYTNDSYSNIVNNGKLPIGIHYGALYLCVQILSSCKELAMSLHDFSEVVSAEDTWWHLLKKNTDRLSLVLGSVTVARSEAINSNIRQEHVLCGVKGLQILASFPECYSMISEDAYHNILLILVSNITCKYEDAYLQKLSLEALVQIGSSIEKYDNSKRGVIYKTAVVDRIISLLQHDNTTMPLSLILDAVCEIGAVGLNHMSRVIRVLEEAVIFNMSQACIGGRTECAEIVVPLLECYSSRVIPWLCTSGDYNEVARQFAFLIWKQMEILTVSSKVKIQGLLDSLMMTMKLLVGVCTEEYQSLIAKNAYDIVLSMTFFPVELLSCPSFKLDEFEVSSDILQDECLVSLFASVVISLRPETPLPDLNAVLNYFLFFLLKGHIPAAQALASILNKWLPDIIVSGLASEYTFDKAVEVILESCFSCFLSRPLRKCNFDYTKDVISCLHISDNNVHSKVHIMVGLAWIGKGLLMRGDEKVKAITMFLLKHLLPCQDNAAISSHPQNYEDRNASDVRSLLATNAADAFHVLMSDSEVCLNKKCHATIKPLYKQRFFTVMMPILLSSIKESTTLNSKITLYRAFGHVISDAPLAAVVAEAPKITHIVTDILAMLSLDVQNKALVYSLLLVLSGILMDANGKESIIEDIHSVIGLLTQLVSYPHMMLVRETAIQCLVAMSALPHSRIYPMRLQVLRAVVKALDDKKWAVRQEAVRCRQAWESIASRSLHF